MEKIAICPGSFDPVTNGHVDIITRASKMFDKVIVVVMTNYAKSKYTFSTKERVEFLKKSAASIENVEIDYYNGLLAEYAKIKGAVAIVKGLRAVTDFEYEFQQALTNKMINSQIETIFLTANVEYMFLSSSIVKQICALGGDVFNFVPNCILKDIETRILGKGVER